MAKSLGDLDLMSGRLTSFGTLPTRLVIQPFRLLVGCSSSFRTLNHDSADHLEVMTRIANTNPLADFVRDAKVVAKRMRRTQQPEFLAIDGSQEIVLMDADIYRRLLDLAESAGAIAGIRRGLRDVEDGRHMSLAELDARIRRKHKLPKRA